MGNSGTIDFLGTGNPTNLTIANGFSSGGTIKITLGTLTISAGTLTIDAAGILTGNGTLVGNVNNSGTIKPGTSPGILTINGNLTLNPSSILDIELASNGGTPGTDFDQIVVNGNANLDGTLNVTSLAAFTPSGADSFQIITCTGACNGTGGFATELSAFGTTMAVNVNALDVLLDTFLSNLTQWTGLAFDGGLWATLGNWDNGVPNAGIDALLDIGGGNTITVNTGTQTANKIQSVENLLISGGSLDVGDTSLFNGNLTITGGTLTGAGDITVSGLTSWTNPSTIGGGPSATLFANGGLDLVQVSSSNWILDRTLELGGNSNWLTTGISGVRILSGSGSITNKAVLTLVPFDPGSQSEARRLQVQVPFTNTATGTVTKNGGKVGADFQMTFDNAGTVNGDDAQFLRLSGGGTHTGDFSTASGGILQFSGTPVFNSGVDFTGAGTVEFLSGTSTLATGVTYNSSGTTIVSGATVNFDSSGITSLGSLTVSSGTANLNTGNAQTLTTLSVSGGTLQGTDNITVSGLTSWANTSTIGGGASATLFANGGLNLSQGANATWTLDRALVLGGNSNWSPSSTSDFRILTGTGSITNNAILTLAPNDPGLQNAGNRLQVEVPFTNTATGTVTKNGGNVTADFKSTFDNAGTVNGDDAQALTFSGGGTHIGDFSTASGGLLEFVGTHTFSGTSTLQGIGTVDVSAITFTNNGTITPGAGTLTITGDVTNAGTIDLNGNTLFISGSSSSNTVNGILTGTGTLNMNGGANTFTNSGEIRPGTSPGITNITGNLFLDSTSILVIELADFPTATPGTSFDRINVSGIATLDGTLDVLEFGAFTANATDFFDIMTYASSAGPGIQTITADFGDFYSVASISGDTVLRLTMDFNNLFKTWDDGGDGFTWDDPLNWSGNAVPLISEDVLVNPIAGSIVVDSSGLFNVARQLSMPDSLDSLTITSGGDLTLDGDSSIAGNFTISTNNSDLFGIGDLTVTGLTSFGGGGSTISGTGALFADGGFNIDAGGGTTLTINRDVQVQSGGTWTDTGSSNIDGTGTITNTLGSTITATNTGDFNVNIILDNLGTLTHTGSGDFNINSTLTNNNIINANGGSLQLNSGGTVTGAYNVASGATLEFISGTTIFDGSSNISGAGNVIFDSVTTVNGTYAITGNTTVRNAGTVATINTNTTMGSLTVGTNPATLQGTGDFTVTGLTNWTGNGSTIGGSGTLFANGGFDIPGGGGSTRNLSRNVEVQGGGFWNGTTSVNGLGTILNTLGNTITDNGTATVTLNVDIDNQGILTSSGTGSLILNGALLNNNTINANDGTVQINSGGTVTGAYNVASGATLEFISGTTTLDGSSNISGAGNVIFDDVNGTTINGSYGITGNTRVQGTSTEATFNTNWTTDTLTVTTSTGTLGGTGTITVSGLTSWEGSSSTIDTGGTLFANGGFNIDGGGGTTKTLNRLVEIDGDSTWTDTGPTTVNGTGTIRNMASRIITATNTGDFNVNIILDNLGTLTHTGSGDFNINSTLTNNNIINANGGSLQLNSGGTVTGAYNVASGATLEFISGTTIFDGSSNISGAGNVIFDSVTTVNGTYAITGNTTVRNAGTVATINTNTTMGSLTVGTNPATLQGTGDFTVTGLTNWTGNGSTIGGSGTLFANGGFDIPGGGGSTRNLSRNVEVQGGGFWNGTTSVNGLGTILNTLGNTITDNGTATVTLNVDIDNQGILTSSGTGSLILNGGTLAFFTTSGDVNVDAGTLDVNSTTFNWNGGALAGAGTLDIFGVTTFSIGGSATKTLSNFTLAPGSLTVGGTGILDINGGTMNIAGITTINSGATLRVSTATFNPSGVFNNNGILDLNAGTLSLGSGGTHTGDFGIGTGTVLQFTGGAHVMNSGSDTSGAGDIAFTGGTSTYNAGSTYTISGDTGINGGDVNFNIAAVTNTLTHAANTLGGTGSLTTTGWTPTSGVTVNNNLILASGFIQTLTSINIIGTGTVENQGTLTLDTVTFPNLTNNGTLDPGASPGTTMIGGNFIQGSSGVLNIELGGTAPGDFDQLQIGLTASLDGILNIIMCTTGLCPSQGNFTGTVGDTFNIMTYSGLPIGLGDFITVNQPTGYAFGNNTPFNNFYQLSITGLPGSGGPPPGSGNLIDATDQVIVLNDFQEELGSTFGELIFDEEDEGERELVCR